MTAGFSVPSFPLGTPCANTYHSAHPSSFGFGAETATGVAAAALVQNPPTHDTSVAGLQAQAADFEFMAAQLMAQAYQAKAKALRAQSGGDSGLAMPMTPMQIPVLMGQTVATTNGQLAASSIAPMISQSLDLVERRAPAKNSGFKGPTKRESERTTICLRNLPNDYTRAMVLELLDEQGFTGCYNFIYLPMDFKRRAGLGYAFVNMVTPSDAQRAFARLTGFTEWKMFCSAKVLEIGWGDPLQGLDAHVHRYRNSPVMHEDVPDEFRPMLFQDGQRIAFPPATRKLREPRLDFRDKH